jgi:hypothetical protein
MNNEKNKESGTGRAMSSENNEKRYFLTTF